MDARLLEILVCPLCKGPLDHRKLSDQTGSELVCKACRLGFPIKDDIPIMLEDEARQMPAEEE